MTRFMAILAITTVVGSAIDASAAPLAPSKPSQLVTVTGASDGPACPGPGPGSVTKQINLVLKPEGGNAPFAIPPKSIFIVTSYDFLLGGVDPGRYGTIAIFAVGPAGEFGSQAFSSALADNAGSVFATGIVPSGLVVKPPATLCAFFGQMSGSVIVHGFFAKDK